MKGKFTQMVSFQKLRVQRKPDQKLATRTWNVCVFGAGRNAIFTSKEISSTIENGAGRQNDFLQAPLGAGMIFSELMGNYCMDI